MFTAKICPWLVNVSGWPTVGIAPHMFLISRMLTDYVIEHFLLKIAFETAKMFPALAKKCLGEKKVLGFRISSWKMPTGVEKKSS